jgi:alginate O-acetyltransferase complex protein AlgJ
VIVSDLRPALSREPAPFLRTDTHWTPAGAAAAARAIAATVRERAPFPGLGETRFETTTAATEERWGDLTTFLDLGPLLDDLGPPPDVIAVPSPRAWRRPPPTCSVGSRCRSRWSARPTAPTRRGTRSERCATRLGADVIDAALTGLGPWEPMHRYLTGEALRSSPPEVVIWEIPERYLTLAGHVPEAPAW